jgi:thiamine-monophosphate kinase
VTGTLGGAALAVARSELRGVKNRRLAVPRLAAGVSLGRMSGVGGCIDVSDGLLSDLGHLLAAPGLGADIDLAAVPRPPGFRAACRSLGVDPDALSLAGGEDYELLFTVRKAARLSRASLELRLGLPVSEVGEVRAEPGLGGVPLELGWRHF